MADFDWKDPNITVGDKPHPVDVAAKTNPFAGMLSRVAGAADRGETAFGQEFLHQMNPINMVEGIAKLNPFAAKSPSDYIQTLGQMSGITPAIQGAKEIANDPSSLKRPISAEEVGGAIGQGAALGAQGALVGRLAPSSGATDTLRSSAAKNYVDVLNPTTPKDVPVAEGIAKRMADEGITARSAGSLQNQAQDIMAQHDPNVYSGNVPPTGKMQMFQDLEDLRNKTATIKGSGQIVEPNLNAYIDNLKAQLTGMQDPQTGEIPEAYLRNWREILGRKQTSAGGRFKAGEELAPESKSALDDAMRSSISDALHKNNTPGAAVDARYNFGSTINDFMEAQRRAKIISQGQPGKNLFQAMTTSKATAIPRNIITFMDSVPWNTVSGATKMKIADSITKGNWAGVTKQLQLVKLGVPITNEQTGPPVQESGARTQ